MADEQFWIDKAQTAEAQIATMRDQVEPLREKCRHIKETFGARERSDGSFDIDYQAFVDNLGMEAALEVRKIIDETYNVSGAPGEKPKVKGVQAATNAA